MLNFVKILKITILSVVVLSFLAFVYAESPPPPPPPCTIQSAGCYKTGDVKAGFGELAPSEFGYFLPENKCKREGGCDCRGVPDNIVEEKDPDGSSGACTCIAGTDWNAKARCCGDDAEDCGRISSGVLCSIDANAETANWVSSDPNIGDIRYVGCGRVEYLSDGNTWHKCDGAFWRRTVGNSEYICTDKGRESIVECCGDGSCKSRIDGKRLATGQSVAYAPINIQCPIPECPAPPTGCRYVPENDERGCPTCGELVCPEQINSGLILHWKFDEGSGTTAIDSSGNNINGNIINGATYVDGRIGKALNFNGISYVEVPHDPRLSLSSFTLATWIKVDSTTGERSIIDKRGANGEGGYQIRADGSSFPLSFILVTKDEAPGFPPYEDFTEAAAIPQGQWVHVAAVFDNPANRATVYVDGIQVASRSTTRDPSVNPTGYPLRIGEISAYNFGAPSAFNFKGVIDEVRIYNRVLSEGEIKSLYLPSQPIQLTITTTSLPQATTGLIYSASIQATGGGGVYTWGYSGNLPLGLQFGPAFDCNRVLAPICHPPATISGTLASEGTYTFTVFVSDGRNTASKEFTIVVNEQIIVQEEKTKTYYCRSDRKFVIDLDVPNSQINDKALIGKNKATCEKAGFKWTGTKCCSEDDDPNEYYNDVDGTGGCWDKKPIISVNFVEGTDNSVVNYKGGFYGCAISESNYNKDNDALLNIPDKHTGGALITDSDYCDADPENSYYCSYTEKWLPTEGADRSHLSFAPTESQIQKCPAQPYGPPYNCPIVECVSGYVSVQNPITCCYKCKPTICPSVCVEMWELSKDKCVFNKCGSGCGPDGITTFSTEKECISKISTTKQKAECCASGECWDGEKCTANQKNNPLAQPLNGFRCVDGEWTSSTLVFTPDDTAAGFCPKSTQCLVKVFGSGNNCIESGQYVDDNYCENGVWSSRTKLLALKLLKLKSGDYTLFCDSRENALNNLQYITESGDIVANVLTNLQTNNFCVLKAGNVVVAAVSINKNLEDVPRNSLNILGVTNCDRALIDDGQYHSCDATNKVWFNKRLKSFVYSSTAINVPPDEASFEEFIGNPIKSIIDAIKRLIIPPPYDESYVKGIKKFDKLYMLQHGSKTIKGSIEGRNFKNAVIAYSGFDTDICELIGQFNKAKKDAASGISCKKEGSNYYVLAQGSQFTSLNPEAIWADLTAKLRLK